MIQSQELTSNLRWPVKSYLEFKKNEEKPLKQLEALRFNKVWKQENSIEQLWIQSDQILQSNKFEKSRKLKFKLNLLTTNSMSNIMWPLINEKSQIQRGLSKVLAKALKANCGIKFWRNTKDQQPQLHSNWKQSIILQNL